MPLPFNRQVIFDMGEAFLDWATLDSLLSNLDKEQEYTRSTAYLRLSSICKLSQMYFDALVDRTWPKEDWKSQITALENLVAAGVLAARSFHISDESAFKKSNYLIQNDSINLHKLLNGSEKARTLHIDEIPESERHQFINGIEELKKNGYRFDTLVCIAGGGFGPVFMAGDVMPESDVFTFRFSHFSRADKGLRFPSSAPNTYAGTAITGKAVLVVDDLLATGKTAGTVLKELSKFTPRKLVYSVMSAGCKKLPDNPTFNPLHEYIRIKNALGGTQYMAYEVLENE